MRHMFYGSFGSQNMMAAFISGLDPSQSQLGSNQVKKVKFLKTKFSSKNMLILSSFVSGFPKNVIYFYIQQLEMPKSTFKKVAS